ncbi:MAG: chromosomal replication initiator protein DnaA [Eubacteriales bacterium]|nr:chromosomal replication initiator protein DnaA [Eubacteriales bacterium]
MFEDIQNKWNEILDFMRDEFELSDLSYNSWLVPLKLHKLEKGKLYIIASENKTVVAIVSKKFKDYLSIAINFVTRHEVEPVFISADEADSISEISNEKTVYDPYMEAVRKSNLNEKFTFENFVSGKSNELAHAAALAVAESPGRDYRILYIYGGTGLGKTHLMQAIAHHILKKRPSVNILYATAETFTNEFIESIKPSSSKSDMTPSKFRTKYRTKPDVLMIDDIQFIAKKAGIQEEFFHTFNELYDHNKQIVITSDTSPKDIDNLEERIRSRFEGGLVVDIQMPDYETRMAILRKKEEMEGFNIDDEVIKYIAENVVSNIRELEGALHKVVLKSKLTQSRLDLDMAKDTLSDIIRGNRDKEAPTPARIISIVSEHFGISEKDMISERKNKEIAFPRQIAMYLCCENTEVPQQTIGEIMHRDHSTIIYGRDKISEEMKKDPQLKITIESLTKKIRNQL